MNTCPCFIIHFPQWRIYGLGLVGAIFHGSLVAIEQQMWSDFLNGRDMRERDEKEKDMRAQHGN